MSNTIPPLRQTSVPHTDKSTGQAGAAATPQAGVQNSTTQNSTAQNNAAQADSVTLSATAQSGAQLLSAAQNASGVDHGLVASIRAQLANGSYNVAPETLAQAIATVLKETKS